MNFSGLHYCLFVKVLCSCRISRSNSVRISLRSFAVKNFFIYFLLPFAVICLLTAPATLIILSLGAPIVNAYFDFFLFFSLIRFAVYILPEIAHKKNVACDILAPSAVAFMQHIPIARVRIHSGAFFMI